jgi:hypothetical protein
VIAGALGGGLVIDVCSGCNRRANREVDIPLVRCHHVARVRAQACVRDARGRVYEFTEVLDGRDGMLLEATWSGDEICGRFLPVEIAITDTVSHIFIDPEDAEEHYEKQRARAAARGLTYGPPQLGPPDLPRPPPEGSTVAALFRSRECPHPQWLWASAIAKVALGCLSHASRLGVVPERTARSGLAAALRLLAFDHELDLRVWRLDDAPFDSLTPSPAHRVAGTLRAAEHLFALYPAERPGQSPLAQLVLFGCKLVELPRRVYGSQAPTAGGSTRLPAMSLTATSTRSLSAPCRRATSSHCRPEPHSRFPPRVAAAVCHRVCATIGELGQHGPGGQSRPFEVRSSSRTGTRERARRVSARGCRRRTRRRRSARASQTLILHR